MVVDGAAVVVVVVGGAGRVVRVEALTSVREVLLSDDRMGEISYPTVAMRSAAHDIRSNAAGALERHLQHWQQVQSSIAPRPGFIRSATTPGGQVANPTFVDSLYTYAWFVTFALSFVLYLIVARRDAR